MYMQSVGMSCTELGDVTASGVFLIGTALNARFHAKGRVRARETESGELHMWRAV